MSSGSIKSENVRHARPPDWRSRQADDLVTGGRRIRRRDDFRVRQAVRFQREICRCEDEKARDRLARRYPAFAEAHALYSIESSWQRWELEARLLTDLPFMEGRWFGGFAAADAVTPAAGGETAA